MKQEDSSACVIWQGNVATVGYGMVGNSYAHRLAYAEAHGPIPAGMYVHHTCHEKLCVNPEHLELMSPEEHGRLHQGDRVPFMKLSPDDVREIRQRLAKGQKPKDIAADYGVTKYAIYDIKWGRRRRAIP